MDGMIGVQITTEQAADLLESAETQKQVTVGGMVATWIKTKLEGLILLIQGICGSFLKISLTAVSPAA
jgi:hypothetical protein